jgi:hypothetical protein
MRGALVAALIVALAWWLSPSRGTDEIVDHDVIRVEVPEEPCANEDGPGPCYWDATTRGNGYGLSYWIDERGNYLYDDGRVVEPDENNNG